MKKETNFLIYCMERYRHFKGLSGKEVSELFNRYDVDHYLSEYFELLHIVGDKVIVKDIDDYIAQAS